MTPRAIYRLSDNLEKAENELAHLVGAYRVDFIGPARLIETLRESQWQHLNYVAKNGAFPAICFGRIFNSQPSNCLSLFAQPNPVRRHIIFPASLLGDSFVAYEVDDTEIYIQFYARLNQDASRLNGISFRRWLDDITQLFPDKLVTLTAFQDVHFSDGMPRPRLEKFYQLLGFTWAGHNEALEADYWELPPRRPNTTKRDNFKQGKS